RRRLNLVPYPRSLRRTGGFYTLPAEAWMSFDRIDLPLATRLQQTAAEIGVRLALTALGTHQAAITCRILGASDLSGSAHVGYEPVFGSPSPLGRGRGEGEGAVRPAKAAARQLTFIGESSAPSAYRLSI